MSETEAAQKRILFVDDDTNVLNGLRRMLHSMRGQWKMEFVNKGSDALTVMESTRYDVIVSDLRMPDMDGIQLLETVRRKHPDTIRFMLSGFMDKPLQSQAARCVHQFLPKPCDADLLRELFTRAFVLYGRLRSQTATQILARLRSLPVLPKVYQEVIDLLQKPTCSLRQVGQMIAKDIGMSSKILQVVNNAFTGQDVRIVDPVHAVSYLGQKATEALVLTSGVFSKLPKHKLERFGVSALQEHCIRVGALAREICRARSLGEQEQDTATVAGILHDAGKMVLIWRFEEELAKAVLQSRQQGRATHEVEREAFGITHAELGGCLLDLWGLPSPIIETVTFHHEPEHCLQPGFSVITAVHVADAIDQELCCQLGGGWPESLRMEYLDKIGVAECVDQWRAIHLPSLEEAPQHVG